MMATGRLAARLLHDLWVRFRWRVPVLMVLIVVAGTFEGFAIALLLPLLAVLGITGQDQGQVEAFTAAFSRMGIDMTLGSVVAVIGGIVILQYSSVLLQNWVSASMQSAYLRMLREETFRDVLNADWPYLTRRSVGSMINAVTSETGRVASCVYVVVQLVSAIAVTLIFVGIALALSWELTLLLLGAAGLVAAVLRPIMVWSRALGAETSVQYARSLGWLNEVFNGAKLIKATAAERHVERRHAEIEAELARIQRGMLFQPHLLRTVFEASGILLLLAALALATTLFGLQGGIVITVVALFMRLYPRLGNLQHLVQQLLINVPAVENLERLKVEMRENAEALGKEDGIIPPGDIVIENLHARYDERPVLQGIDLRLEAGGHYAFVGPSGAGKTSLVDCLLGLARAERGDIRVGDASISAIGLGRWRRSVGYVTQDTVLFNMTIRDNIAWSNTEASAAEVEAAARRANAHEFIMATPLGYETVVGDRGVMLSGGQRQRLGLARALLGERALLVLDEATSALDTESELAILKAISDLRGRLTVIMIAHRLSTVRFCDKIFMLDKGRIVEEGSWGELTGGESRFAGLLDAQRTP